MSTRASAPAADLLALPALARFERELRRRGVKTATLTRYRGHLRALLADVAAGEGVSPDELTLEALTPALLADALAAYRDRPDQRFTAASAAAAPPTERAPASVRARLTALRGFTRWCVEEELLTRDPARSLTLPTTPPPPRQRLTEDEARDVLRAARLSRWSARDGLIVGLVLTMGATLAELRGLTLRAVDYPGPGEITLAARPGRERALTCSPLVSAALESYLPERAALLTRRGARSAALLCSARTGEALTEAGLAAVLTRCLRGAGLEERGLRAQALRATFATLALSSGAYTLPELSAALGTSSLAALGRLASMPRADLTRAASAHPLARA